MGFKLLEQIFADGLAQKTEGSCVVTIGKSKCKADTHVELSPLNRPVQESLCCLIQRIPCSLARAYL